MDPISAVVLFCALLSVPAIYDGLTERHYKLDDPWVQCEMKRESKPDSWEWNCDPSEPRRADGHD